MAEPPPAPRSPPYSLLLGIACAFLVVAAAQGPMGDPDIYWHLLAGGQLASGSPADSLGLDWTFAPDPRPWTSTQWLAELLLYLIHQAGSWAGVALFVMATAAVSPSPSSRDRRCAAGRSRLPRSRSSSPPPQWS